MKHILYILLLAAIPLGGLYAQQGSDVFERHFPAILDNDELSQVVISSKMFSLFMNLEMDDPDHQDLVEMIGKLDGLKVITGTPAQIGNSSSIDALMRRPASDMDELMRVKDGKSNVIFYINESSGRVNELAMIAHEDDQVVILSLTGDIDINQLSKLGAKMDIDGFDHLDHIERK